MVHSYIAFIQPFSLRSFILHRNVAAVICDYRTNNGNTFYHGNVCDMSGIGSILLGAVLLVAELMALPRRAATLLEV
jgi:hypothetical protein